MKDFQNFILIIWSIIIISLTSFMWGNSLGWETGYREASAACRRTL